MFIDTLFKLIELNCKLTATGNQFTQLYESTNHIDTHSDSLFAVKYIRCHNGTMFGKREG